MNKKTMYLIAAASLFFAWLFRFEIVAAGSGETSPMAYRLDRWTGAVMLAVPSGTVKLEAYKAPKEEKRPEEPEGEQWWKDAPVVK
ncbi:MULTISPECIES: hypothetical protein [Delftia]|uniref:hypothetical protein n=1 Tax=Delftia TaxID=80865 RepID=UPI000F842F1A|nr:MULTISPECIES: hypothetical protein [Delftia]